MTTFTLPLLDAKHLAHALLPHISTDDVTPVLTGFVVTGQYAYATDRYTVGRFDLTNILVGADSVEEPVWIPRAALAWVKSVGQASLIHNWFTEYKVRFTYHRHERYESSDYVSVEYLWTGTGEEPIPEEVHLLRLFHSKGSRGNYPPIARLFDSFLPGEVGVVGWGPTQVEKFTAYAKYVNRSAPMKITFPAESTTAKPMPALIEIGARFKGLIQPNLILGDTGFGVNLAEQNRLRHEEEERKRADASTTEATEGGE